MFFSLDEHLCTARGGYLTIKPMHAASYMGPRDFPGAHHARMPACPVPSWSCLTWPHPAGTLGRGHLRAPHNQSLRDVAAKF